jgi:hypothetical protein
MLTLLMISAGPVFTPLPVEGMIDIHVTYCTLTVSHNGCQLIIVCAMQCTLLRILSKNIVAFLF